jgi:lysozyme
MRQWLRLGRASGEEPQSPAPIEPMEDPAPRTGKAKLAALVGGAALGMIAVVGGFEGYSSDPYKDIVGVSTVCYGETRVAMRRYSKADCDDMLAAGLSDFAGAVLERNPELKGHDAQLLAATSLAYNIGTGAYRKSTVAKRFSAGNWKGACDAFLLWNKAGGRVVKGLDTRRRKERAICLRGL